MLQVMPNRLEKGLKNPGSKWCIILMGIDKGIPDFSKLRGSEASPRQTVVLGIVRLTVPTVYIPIGMCKLLQMKRFP